MNSTSRRSAYAALGVVTAQVYGPYVDNPTNAAFIKAYQSKYGSEQLPSIITMKGYDGMRVISEMLKATEGKLNGDAAMAAIKGFHGKARAAP